MYQSYPSLVLGFHGCEREVGEEIIQNHASLKHSTNEYDWLGNGMYFWENSPERAKEWAQHNAKTNPFVLGAVIDLGLCFNLLDHSHLALLKESYKSLVANLATAGKTLPENEPVHSHDDDELKRNLDCAVINFLHAKREMDDAPAFDSVRGAFFEGPRLYRNAGFREKSHIQLAIRNPNCIKGFFYPRSANSKHPRV